MDPLNTLQAALTAPADSPEQYDLLNKLRESLEAHPAPIPLLLGTLITLVINQPDSTLKRWVLNLLQFAICRSTLSFEIRTTLSSQMLDTLVQLLEDTSSVVVSLAIQCLTGAYPLLFRQLCTVRTNPQVWNLLSTAKTRIITFLWSQEVNAGVKLASVKFVQRVILVQTRAVVDPRLQKPNDPSLALCPNDHPFMNAQALGEEGTQLLQGIIMLLYSSPNPDLISAILNSWSALTKQRPNTMGLVIEALTSWTPAALAASSAGNIRSAEKSLKILLIHISRTPNSGPFAAQINDALSRQAARMDKAAAEEKQRKAAALDSRKRSASVLGSGTPDAKRAKLEQMDSTAQSLAGFDFTSLPAALITELIVANLEAFQVDEMMALIRDYKQLRGIVAPVPPAPVSAPPIPPVASSSSSREPGPPPQTTTPPPPAPPEVRDDPVDPLKMEIDEEDLVYEPDRIDAELSGDRGAMRNATLSRAAEVPELKSSFMAIDFKVPPPELPDEEERQELIRQSTARIMDGASLGGNVTQIDASGGYQPSAGDMWMLMMIRMITRVARPLADAESDAKLDEEAGVEGEEGRIQKFYELQDQQRRFLCDYIMEDFSNRIRIATLWMNEEWYNDQIHANDPYWQPNYETWVNQVISVFQTHLDGKDRTFSKFLLDLPLLPSDILALLRDMCVDPERMPVGFNTLKGIVVQRPALRLEALTILLDLTTHPEKMPRTAAINTVRQWVPNVQPMDSIVRHFALQMLRKLQPGPGAQQNGQNGVTKVEGENEDDDEDEKMEDGQLTPEEVVQTPYLPERIALPAEKAQVLQHVELLFALSAKNPELLEEIFAAYAHMDSTVQQAIQELITALIRSLGPNHGKLLTLMRNFPKGSESLALRVLAIFTDHGRASSQLVALVKALINERDLDARFLIPIIAEMDKPDILRHLPKIVSILNGEAEPKNLVKSVLSSVVTTPPQSFGTVSSNLPRVRQSELLTPAELLVLLHESEKEIGRKAAMEAVGICFSMTDVFRPEIFAVFMQQVMDERDLPVLFLRTVIQAVTTYKSLVGFVSTTLLSRLITKKIWTNPPLWEGFIRCAKAIAPASFSALLQLPKEQLKELVEKQPSLKSGLKDFVTKKSGNKARAMASLVDIFGPDAEEGVLETTTPPVPASPMMEDTPA